ncbi:glycosyltransferase family 87 protein [Kolteria novifilia]|uniref:glycosyltransferase family 87 protein n=1 Tax=Kolteria novifilia TaxID=2527975 RepID=UPI003AF3E15C
MTGRFRLPAPLMTAFIVFFLVVGTYYVVVKGTRRSAINRWKPMVAELLAGEDIYRKFAFPTPPIMALVLVPFTSLAGAWTMGAWYLLRALLAIAALILLLRMVQPIYPRWSLSAQLGLFLLISRPIMGDLLHGNVNLWILFLVVAGFAAFRQGWDWTAGGAISLAAACKLTPVLLVPYFAVKRQFRLVAIACVGLVAWTFLVPGMALGMVRNAELVRHWAEAMVVPYVVRGEVTTEQINQSVPALIHRFTTAKPAIFPDDGRPPITLNLVALSGTTVTLVTKGVSLTIFLALLWACRTRWPERRHVGYLHEFGLVLIATLWLSERTWKHHYVLLVPSFVFLVATVARLLAEGDRRRGVFLASGLGFAGMAMASTSNDLAKPLFGEDGPKVMQAYGAYLWASLAVAACHLNCIVRLRDRKINPPEGSSFERITTCPVDTDLPADRLVGRFPGCGLSNRSCQTRANTRQASVETGWNSRKSERS